METNEIMNNEVAIETAEEVIKTGGGKSLKVLVGTVILTAVCGAAYKFVIKPVLAKRKADKNQPVIVLDEDAYVDEFDETDED